MAWRRNKIHFAMKRGEHVVWLLWAVEVDGTPIWSETAFNWHFIREDRKLPEATGDEHLPVTIILASAEDSIVRVLRMVTMSKSMSMAISQAIATQASKPNDPQRFIREVNEIYTRYPTTAELAAACDIIEVAGITD